MSRVLPSLDEYSHQPGLSPSMYRLLDEKGVEQFISWWKNSDEYDPALDNSENGPLLRGWINARGVPFSLRNCQVAWRDMEAEGSLIRIPVEEEHPAPAPMTITNIWPADTRPKSATSLVLDPKTAELQAKAAEERKARVVERQSEPIPSLSVEEARQLVPLPKGEDKRHQTLKQVQKDRKLDITELRDAANRERIAIAKSRGTYNRGY